MTVEETSEFQTWAQDELARAGLFEPDSDYDGMIGREVMRLIDTFAGQGHSGFSALMTASVFKQLTERKPLTPLTNHTNEWMSVDMGLWQSTRAASCFSNDGGKSYYDIDEELPLHLHLLDALTRRLGIYKPWRFNSRYWARSAS